MLLDFKIKLRNLLRRRLLKKSADHGGQGSAALAGPVERQLEQVIQVLNPVTHRNAPVISPPGGAPRAFLPSFPNL